MLEEQLLAMDHAIVPVKATTVSAIETSWLEIEVTPSKKYSRKHSLIDKACSLLEI